MYEFKYCPLTDQTGATARKQMYEISKHTGMSSITNMTLCILKSFQLGQLLIAACLIALIGLFPLVYTGVFPSCQGK